VTAPVRAAVFVGTRADLGPLAPVLTALAQAPDVRLTVLTGVAYAAVEHGWRLARGSGRWFLDAAPDVLVVLGDRWELLHVVPQAVLAQVRVVHLHGGEVTEGAVDERIRHALTKLADQHCVASPDAARRVRRLGEVADRVHVTGAPGLDRLVAAVPADDVMLASILGRAPVRPLALFTYHPPTAVEGADVRGWAAAALAATAERCGTVLATHPGVDAGRDDVLAALADAAADPGVVVVEALGRDYPAVLAAADVVVGNSSSGVIEAATVGVPAVDVGERQRGRLRGDNVVHADEGHEAVAAALDTALSPAFRKRAGGAVNPYGDGRAAARIADVVRAAPRVPRSKPFDEGAGR
jgi:UDP-N-acetylglucosamine 2-epimerase (non-hydrolysing)